MNLYQLRYFSVLAETQHYGKAAEKLCIAQPSLSHAISQPLLSALREGIYDMVFCTRLEQEISIDFFPVAHQDLVLIVPKGHPLSGLASVDLSASLVYPHICFTPDSDLRSVVDQLFKKIGRFPEIAYEIQEDEVIAGLVAQKSGIMQKIRHSQTCSNHWRMIL